MEEICLLEGSHYLPLFLNLIVFTVEEEERDDNLVSIIERSKFSKLGIILQILKPNLAFQSP